jgi:hypothetical protein
MFSRIAFFVLILSACVFAQNTSYIEVLKSDVKTQRRALITEAMGFTEEQAQKFWPIYKEYEIESDKLVDREFELLKKYADTYGNMSDEMADILINQAMDLDEDQLKLKRKYYKKFKNELGAKTSAKFRMIDNRIDLMINLQIASGVPVID